MTDERIFADCQDGRHAQCMVQFKRPDGTVAMRCSCTCGHGTQRERELVTA